MQGGSSEQGRHVTLAKCVGDLLDRYSAALALHGTTLAPYYLDEESNWGLSIPHLREQVKKVRSHGSSQPSMHAKPHVALPRGAAAHSLQTWLAYLRKRKLETANCRPRRTGRRCGRWW